MASINYEDLLSEIIPMVPGCTDTLIERSIRSAVIELCEKAEVYQYELDPITTVSGTYEYDFEVPNGTAVHKILWVTYDGDDLESISSSLLEEREPKWRDSNYYGTPIYYIKQSQAVFWLAPVPDVTKTNSVIEMPLLMALWFVC